MNGNSFASKQEAIAAIEEHTNAICKLAMGE
jgi:hypothetical protein